MIGLKRSLVVCLTVIGFLGASASAKADTQLYAPLAPSGFTGTNIGWNYTMGYSFTPNHSITVTQLGGAFYGRKNVYLYDNASGTILRSATVSGLGFAYTYAPISPITLTAGTTYVVGVWLAGSGGDYYTGSTNLLAMANNDVTVNASCYIPNSTANPCSSVSTLGTMYGVADLQYTGGVGLNCRTLTTPGHYTLTGSQVSSGNCVTFNNLTAGPATTLDCQLHSITAGTYGKAILVQNVNNGSGVNIKNCVLDSTNEFQPLDIESSSNSSVTNTTIGSLHATTSTAAVRVYGSSSISLTANNIYGETDVVSSTLSSVKQNQVYCASAAEQSVGISFLNGSQNTMSGNIVAGNWNGSSEIGCDDGLFVTSESNDTLTDNNITNCWDMGIETSGLVQNTHFDNNIISYIPVNFSGGAGIGGWYDMSYSGCSFSGNVMDHTDTMFKTTPDGVPYAYTDFHFLNNSFLNNTMTNPQDVGGDYIAGPSVPSSVVGGVPVYETNNVFTGNNWGTTVCAPNFGYYPVPAGNVVDGGGNICKPGCTFGGTEPVSCYSSPACSGWQYNAGPGLGCWYTGAVGQSCNTVCASHGGFNSTTATHTGNRAGTHFSPLKFSGSNSASVECTDAGTNWGATGVTADGTYSTSSCALSCSCNN